MRDLEVIHPYGIHPSFGEQPKRCEDCGKKTQTLYMTPIGCCNWRCEDCQNALVYAIGYEDCIKGHEEIPSAYPEVPYSYKLKYRDSDLTYSDSNPKKKIIYMEENI